MYRPICRSAFRPERQSVLFFIKHKRLLIAPLVFFCSLVLVTAILGVGSRVFAATTLTVTGQIPSGVADQPYNASVRATGGTALYKYSAVSLPKGLTLNK